MNDRAFESETLSLDLVQVHDTYSRFFSQLTGTDWPQPARENEHEEWNLREVVAHLAALTELGQASIEAALRGEAIAFPGLVSRFDFSQFNRQKIDERLHLRPEALSTAFLDALSRSIDTARRLGPQELACTVDLPIYNRPVRVDELLGIQVMHTGLTHAAQVAEPAGVAPLWTALGTGARRRTISRAVRALSLLYRHDLGGEMEAILVFRIGGPAGGAWHVVLSPAEPRSAPGDVARADLTLTFRDASVFYRMFTGRLNLLGAVLTGRLRPRGNLRLFLRFRSLFSVDATE